MSPSTIQRTFALPLGFKATFRWARNGLAVEWVPAPPCIKSARHWRKFSNAYSAARRDFMRDVATAIGGNVAILDTTGEFEVVRPGTKH
ncbi:MAG TPA: hypothetical protein VGU24_15220 [Microvirga sp.]|jgi:hypothetical protein|nr:hypothetical protein [Microvirga sp.]